MRRNQWIAIISLTVPFILFQNCSKINASDMSLVGKSNGQSTDYEPSETESSQEEAETESSEENTSIPEQAETEPEEPKKRDEENGERCDHDNNRNQSEVAECLEGNFEDLTSLSNFKGINRIEGDNLQVFKNGNGKLVLRAKGLNGTLKAIENFGGHIVICNLDVDLIKNTNGTIRLFGSHVDLIENHDGHGAIKLFQGSTVDRKVNVKEKRRVSK